MSSSEHSNEPGGEATELPEIASRILLAAIELFARKGYAATSVREIVQEAQVTNPMLYYYFDSKEGLFRFLTELLHKEHRRQIDLVIERGLGLEQTLVGVVDLHLRGLRESPQVLEFVFNLLFGPQDSSPEHHLLENHETIIDSLEAVFAAAVERGDFVPCAAFDLRWLVHQLLGAVNSHTMRGIKELQRCGTDEERELWLRDNAGLDTAKQLVRFFLHGAGKVHE